MAGDSSSAAPSGLTDLTEIVHVTTADDPAGLVAVQFRFEEGYLQIEVDPDDDTVEFSFDPRQRPALHHWAPQSTPNPMNQHYAHLLGSNSAWRWVLRNQQNHEDAFQIELSTPSATTTLQYLAMASQLQLHHVTEAPT